ncbi:hypothetical protein ACF1G0_34715 [Streptomyces sp. NPDC013953]|uniref:hypothetical protein n=1 Tax=Streptomyces sp. NPDC013953 TaxID=3364868 RepID=UPI00370132B8
MGDVGAGDLAEYEAYSRATYQEGERGTIGTTRLLWRQRYRHSEQFPSCAWSWTTATRTR